jgi:hypothetical protein
MYLLHLRYPSGAEATLHFTSAFARGLVLIALKAQPVAFRIEDPAVRS